MAKFEFKLPDIGEGVAEGEIVNWLVQAGDEVTENQEMVEVMTDKATVTIGAPKAGKVTELRNYGIEDGQVIALVDRETPSRGKELSFLQQVFGNIGGPSASPSAAGPGRPGGSH